MKRRLIAYFKRHMVARKQKEKLLADKYDEMHAAWLSRVDKSEQSVRRKQKESKAREFYEKVFPELRKQREEKERMLNKSIVEGAPANSGDCTENNTVRIV